MIAGFTGARARSRLFTGALLLYDALRAGGERSLPVRLAIPAIVLVLSELIYLRPRVAAPRAALGQAATWGGVAALCWLGGVRGPNSFFGVVALSACFLAATGVALALRRPPS